MSEEKGASAAATHAGTVLLPVDLPIHRWPESEPVTNNTADAACQPGESAVLSDAIESVAIPGADAKSEESVPFAADFAYERLTKPGGIGLPKGLLFMLRWKPLKTEPYTEFTHSAILASLRKHSGDPRKPSAFKNRKKLLVSEQFAFMKAMEGNKWSVDLYDESQREKYEGRDMVQMTLRVLPKPVKK